MYPFHLISKFCTLSLVLLLVASCRAPSIDVGDIASNKRGVAFLEVDFSNASCVGSVSRLIIGRKTGDKDQPYEVVQTSINWRSNGDKAFVINQPPGEYRILYYDCYKYLNRNIVATVYLGRITTGLVGWINTHDIGKFTIYPGTVSNLGKISLTHFARNAVRMRHTGLPPVTRKWIKSKYPKIYKRMKKGNIKLKTDIVYGIHLYSTNVRVRVNLR